MLPLEYFSICVEIREQIIFLAISAGSMPLYKQDQAFPNKRCEVCLSPRHPQCRNPYPPLLPVPRTVTAVIQNVSGQKFFALH